MRYFEQFNFHAVNRDYYANPDPSKALYSVFFPTVETCYPTIDSVFPTFETAYKL